MNYKKSYKILRCGAVGSCFLALLGLFLESKYIAAANILLALGAIGILAAVGQALVFYKCPYCGARFNFRFKSPDYCPKCGKRPAFYNIRK